MKEKMDTDLGRVTSAVYWWTLKWTFIPSEENRWCGILMTLATRSWKSVVRLQTCIKCGKSLIKHSMSSLATGITTAKIKKKKWNWFYFRKCFVSWNLSKKFKLNICLIRHFMVKTANFELQKNYLFCIVLHHILYLSV